MHLLAAPQGWLAEGFSCLLPAVIPLPGHNAPPAALLPQNVTAVPRAETFGSRGAALGACQVLALLC